MVDIGLYSAIELATAFAPNFTVFLVLRAIFGIAMGGEWGLGSALAMEALPANRRGLFSGILQEGYAVGNLLAGQALVFLFRRDRLARHVRRRRAARAAHSLHPLERSGVAGLESRPSPSDSRCAATC